MSRPDAATASRPATEVVLEARDVKKEFDGVVALDGANLDVHEGEIVGVVGPNGAGKTTLFNCIMGTLEATGGAIRLEGEEITDLPTPRVVQRGLSRTFQIPRTFPELTVRENVLAHQAHDGENVLSTLYRGTDEETAERVDELLSFVGLTGHASARASDLSTGQQKLLNLAAVLVPDPDVVLLDEPTAGVNPGLVETIIERLETLNERGRTFLVIEHDMDVVHELTDYVFVLANGTNLTEGPPGEALTDPRVLEAYFGK